MPLPHRLQILHVAAYTLVILSIVFTYINITSISARNKQIKQKTSDLQTLYEIKEHRSQDLSAITYFNQLTQTQLTPLTDIILETLPQTEVELQQRAQEQVTPEWIAKKTDVVFKKVSLKSIERLIQKAETQTPPWRLRECNIVASERQKGTGRVTLSFIGLEKSNR